MAAVEWLVKELNQKIDFIPIDKWDMVRDIVQQAKQMEKDNTIAFGYRCIGEVDSELGDLVYKKVPEEVYNDTYVNKGSDDISSYKQ